MYENAGFELHGLEKLLATTLSYVSEPNALYRLVETRKRLTSEVECVKQCIFENVLVMSDEAEARRYVRQHQYALVAMMDKIFQRKYEFHIVGSYEELGDLLNFLKCEFGDHFDYHARAPLKEIEEVRTAFSASLPILQKELERTVVIDDCIEFILFPLKRFCEEARGRVTFNRLEHLTSIVDCVSVLNDLGNWQDDDFDLATIRFLVFMNYNSEYTYIQLTDFINNFYLFDELTTAEKVCNVSNILKVVNAAPVKAGSGYHPGAPTLKNQLVAYLTGEVEHLATESDEELGSDRMTFSEPPKVRCDLSVSQLGCLLRIFVDSGLMSTNSISALIRCVAQCFETKGARRISAGSLRNKFYDVEKGTQESVLGILGRLMKQGEVMG